MARLKELWNIDEEIKSIGEAVKNIFYVFNDFRTIRFAVLYSDNGGEGGRDH